MKAIILAAGLGTRLKPLTDIVPKPLLPIMNRPIIGAIIDKLVSAGCKKIGVNVHYQHSIIIDYLSKYSSLINISLEDELAGTGGAFLGFKNMLKGNLIIHNCDVISEVDIKELMAFHDTRNPLATLALVKNKETNLVTVDGDRVVRFNKTTDPGNYTYSGIAVISARIADYFPPGLKSFSLIDHVFKNALAHNETILGYKTTQGWIDIGTPGSYWKTHKILAEKKIVVPETGVHAPVCIDKTSIVKTNMIKGFLTVGPGSYIGDSTVLENTVVFAGSRIESGTFRNCLLSGSFCIQDLDDE